MHNAPVMVDVFEPRGKHAQRVVAFTERGFCIMRRQRDGKLSLSIAAVRLPDELAKAILKTVKESEVKDGKR